MTSPAKQPDKRTKYLLLHKSPAYLPLDPAKVSDDFELEGPEHPRLIFRSQTVGELQGLSSGSVDDIIDALAACCVDSDGDFGLARLHAPCTDEEMRFEEQVLRHGLDLLGIRMVNEQRMSANMPSDSEGNV